MDASAPPLDDCLRLLRGERDEQKLAGLLVAANVCRAGDADAVRKVYDAAGPRFLRRLLNTGKRADCAWTWRRASWLVALSCAWGRLAANLGHASWAQGWGKLRAGRRRSGRAYLRLAVTVLAGLARAPEVAADEGVVSTVPPCR
ncbi:hypothetical protein HU200_050104 [Digitaria exilis]|uniref:Uncharacterized protein n=1 Tax=Digitaria exilis TaxID=1010633 RepID=A0A835E9A7_9POAL|nr:hypothetical protein HU200_050104 [Digitaria exilis]